MPELSDFRNELDEIDRDLVRLFERRMAVSRGVGEYKLPRGLAAHDPAREAAMLKERTALLADPSLSAGLERFFAVILDLSREVQEKIFSAANERPAFDSAKQNLYLTGMPGSGKSSIGFLLARKTGLAFVDLDKLIEKREGTTVPLLFSLRGEDGFRDAESRALEAVSSSPGQIVACGGGIVLRPENTETMAKTGTVFFIDRPLSEIKRDIDPSGRPLLSGGADDLDRIYGERIAVYRRTAGHIIENSGAPEAAADRILSLVLPGAGGKGGKP